MAEIEMENYEELGYIKDENGNLIPDYEMTIKLFDDGDIVTGTIVQIDRDEVLVDIGYKSEGVIPLAELSIRKDVNPEEVICIGDEIDALVLQKEDKDGRLILSKKRAEFERSWDLVENHSNDKRPIEGVVIEVVKGGLILDIGLRGFLPASLVDVRRVKDLHQFIGQKFDCLIIEIDRHRNNVVLSRRAVIDEERKHERQKILSNIKKNDVIKGKVSSIVDFGAFVDLGGLDGLVHISEISWNHVDHPSEVLALNQEVEVKVLDIDRERGRVSLGYKQTQGDPWQEKIGDLKVGDEIVGKVVKVVPFGAFVEIADSVEALLHNSEFQGSSELVKAGAEIEAVIADIDVDRRRINLALSVIEVAEGNGLTDDFDEESPVEAGVKTENEAAEVPAETPVETPVFESGKDAIEEDAAAAVEEALDDDAETETKAKLLKKKDEEGETPAKAPEPGSLEDVLQQMKQASKTDE